VARAISMLMTTSRSRGGDPAVGGADQDGNTARKVTLDPGDPAVPRRRALLLLGAHHVSWTAPSPRAAAQGQPGTTSRGLGRFVSRERGHDDAVPGMAPPEHGLRRT
jgi:hypothetical protein